MRVLPKQLAENKFKPGESGNPSGRPKRVEELRALSQANYPLAIKRLGELIQSQDEDMAFQAVSFTFAYVLGRPPEGRDLLQVEMMRSRLSEIVALPAEEKETPAALPPVTPELVAEPLTEPATPRQTQPLPPEATADVHASSEPSGFRCLYRGERGRCSNLMMDGSQWCSLHRDKLFTMVSQ